MLIAIIPLVVCIVGLLCYVLSQNAKVVEVGRVLFWTGALVTLLVAAHQTVKV